MMLSGIFSGLMNNPPIPAGYIVRDFAEIFSQSPVRENFEDAVSLFNFLITPKYIQK